MGFGIVSYQDIDLIVGKWKEFCIFGAGKLGKGHAYEFLKCAGVQVGFYCDNSIEDEREIVDGKKSRPVSYLYENKDRVFVFVCMAQKYWLEIEKQFEEKGIENYAFVNWNTIARVLESVDKANTVVKNRFRLFYDDQEFLKFEFRKKNGYGLNLDRPESFNEKLQWLKLFNHNPKYTELVDKIRFKDYISRNFGEEYTVPVLGVWERFEDIDFSKLPDRYILKCTHDSGSAMIVKNKVKFDCSYAKEFYNGRVDVNYYWMGREWPYKDAQRRIIAEEYLGDNVTDYKFMCFNGEPKCLFTCTERFTGTGLKVTFFDMDFKQMDFTRHYPASEREIKKPRNFDKMVSLAKEISKGIPFVRVDFYEHEDRVYFGEMTFFPGGGMEEFDPVEWDYKLGSWIELPEKMV